MLDSRSGSILRVWAGRVYEIVCFRDRWLVKRATTIAQIIQLTMPMLFCPIINYQFPILFNCDVTENTSKKPAKSSTSTSSNIKIAAFIVGIKHTSDRDQNSCDLLS